MIDDLTKKYLDTLFAGLRAEVATMGERIGAAATTTATGPLNEALQELRVAVRELRARVDKLDREG